MGLFHLYLKFTTRRSIFHCIKVTGARLIPLLSLRAKTWMLVLKTCRGDNLWITEPQNLSASCWFTWSWHSRSCRSWLGRKRYRCLPNLESCVSTCPGYAWLWSVLHLPGDWEAAETWPFFDPITVSSKHQSCPVWHALHPLMIEWSMLQSFTFNGSNNLPNRQSPQPRWDNSGWMGALQVGMAVKSPEVSSGHDFNVW